MPIFKPATAEELARRQPKPKAKPKPKPKTAPKKTKPGVKSEAQAPSVGKSEVKSDE